MLSMDTTIVLNRNSNGSSVKHACSYEFIVAPKVYSYGTVFVLVEVS